MMTNRIEDELLIKKNKELIEKYPFLLVKTDPWTGKELAPEEIDYTITWFDEIPKGWAKAFGKQMCDELLEILKKADCIDEYEIGQIKEKFGTLRWYAWGMPDDYWDEYREWIYKYEDMSAKTCIVCGEPATHMTKGWICPVCDNCG